MNAPVTKLRDAFENIDERPPEFSDDNLALIFAEKYSDNLKYVSSANEWRQWTGTYWQEEKTLLPLDLARDICRSQSSRASELAKDEKKYDRIAFAVSSAKVRYSVTEMAKSDRRIARTIDGWDTDLWILNTPTGTMDLRDDSMRENRREDFCTKITAVGPSTENTPCPLWMKFLDRVTGGDAEFQEFLQRIAGYCLTGSVKEHALFFFYGTGRNGKGVFLNTLSHIFGDYAKPATMQAFMATSGTQHTTDIAMLNGARLVIAQETDQGRHWAESKIKSITGGDPITARKMRQDNFTFEPTFKLVIAGNHKPSLRNVDEAIRSRLHLIPFTVTIPEEERDPDLADKLKEEWPAILQWAIRGCIDWQKHGLKPPECVKLATDEYLADEDSFALWLDECCENDSNSWEKSADLFSSFKSWADKSGEYSGKQKGFSQNLKVRGYTPKKNNVMGFMGIALKRNDYSDDPRYPS